MNKLLSYSDLKEENPEYRAKRKVLMILTSHEDDSIAEKTDVPGIKMLNNPYVSDVKKIATKNTYGI